MMEVAKKYLSRNEEKELSRKISEYNRRASQIAKQKRFQGVYTPPSLDIKAEVNAIENKRDLNRLMRLMENSFKPENLRVVTNKKGVSITAGALRQIRLDIDAANRRLERNIKELEKKPVYIAGQYQGTAAEVNPEVVQERRPIKFDFGNTPTQSQLRFKQERARKASTSTGLRESNENYLANYITAISNRFPSDLAEDIISVLDSMDGDAFFEMMITHPEIDTEFIYSKEDALEKAQRIINTVNHYRGK